MMFAQIVASLEQVSALFIATLEKELLYSSILFLIVLGLTRVLRRQSLVLQYGLWTFVFIRLLLPPDVSFQLSARSLLERLVPSGPAPALQSVPVATQPQTQLSRVTSEQPMRVATVTDNADTGAAAPIFISWQTVLFLLWLTGSVIFIVIFCRSYIRYLRIVGAALPVTNGRVMRYAETWRRRMRIRRTVKVVSSEAFLSPFTIGVFRPVIYLPAKLMAKTSNETVESVVAHEMAHVRHFDDFWIRIQNLVQVFYFFHPVVWLASSRLNQVRERICDEVVLSFETITPRAYGNSMLAILKMNLVGPEGVEMLPGFGSHKKRFTSRLLEITRSTRVRRSSYFVVAIALLLFGFLLLPMAQTLNGGDDSAYAIRLRRVLSGETEFRLVREGGGSSFQSVDSSVGHSFCRTELPQQLSDMEYAAIGIYDSDYRKVWVLKGINTAGEHEFYIDSDGDDCFTGESPLKVRKKTAKYNYEGSSEWVLSRYLKSQVEVKYQDENGRERDFSIYLGYSPEDNFLEFASNEFWLGEATLGESTYPIALYGGTQASWFMRATFDSKPNARGKNQLRIDLNRNGLFEEMPIYDAGRNEVLQEKFFLNETFVVDGKPYEITSIQNGEQDNELKVTIEPVPDNLTQTLN